MLCKHEGLCSIPRAHVQENSSMILGTQNHGAERGKQEAPWGLLANQLSLLGEFQASEKPCSTKYGVERDWGT